MTTYRPKLLFQSNGSEREAWQQLATNPLLHRAIAYTQADMATAGFGPHEMNGVNNFIVGLLNLSENELESKPIPVKKLTSFDEDADMLKKLQELLARQQAALK